ncbi:hypothetical protein HDU80_003282 [Chytriomyces hyalinus]|nr:hypothetical protein HDU80_003282 [Chytriomyces hyalinus]
MRSAVFVFSCGVLVVLGGSSPLRCSVRAVGINAPPPLEYIPAVIHLHQPSSRIPSVFSRTHLAIPFRISSASLGDSSSDLAVLLFGPSSDSALSLQLACVAQNPRQESSTPETQNKAIVQVFDIQWNSLIQNASLSTHPHLTVPEIPTIKLRYRGAERIPGALHLVSISKFSTPYPSIAFLYYVVDGESYHFESKVVLIPGNDKDEFDHMSELPGSSSSTLESDSSCSRGNDAFGCACVNFISNNRESCHHSDPETLVARYILPGNMWIGKFSYSYSGSILYTRQLDKFSYRLISKQAQLQYSPSENNPVPILDSSSSLMGPILDKSIYGSNLKVLAITELYAEEGAHTVLDIRYDSLDEDNFWFYVFLNYKAPGSSEWIQHVIVKGRETLVQMDEIPIRHDDYYFIINPIVAVSKGGKCAMFVYKGSVHVLDHVGPDKLKEESAHGFMLTKSRLVKSLQSNVRVRGMVVSDDGFVASMVTDTDSVVTLKRNYTIRARPEPESPPSQPLRQESSDSAASETSNSAESESAGHSAESFFRSPFDINFLYDSQPSISQIQSAGIVESEPSLVKELSSPVALSKLFERGKWRLESVWNPEFMNEVALREPSTVIVSLALVPKSNPDDLTLLVLNLDEEESGSFIVSFFFEKWKMFLGMGVVIAFFTFNEVRFSRRDAALRAALFPNPHAPHSIPPAALPTLSPPMLNPAGGQQASSTTLVSHQRTTTTVISRDNIEAVVETSVSGDNDGHTVRSRIVVSSPITASPQFSTSVTESRSEITTTQIERVAHDD